MIKYAAPGRIMRYSGRNRRNLLRLLKRKYASPEGEISRFFDAIVRFSI
jgi:hypothetical protein